MDGGGSEGILEHNLLIIYRSIEYIALLRVLEILHKTIVLPLWWFAENCEHPSKWEFGIADMTDVVDLMEKAFAKVQRVGNNIMDYTFIFGIFNKIAK